jgi:hypothetical protein
MGAALVLDHPSSGYLPRYLKRIDAIGGARLLPIVDQEEINRAEAAFELQCQSRLLELLEKATDLEPDNVEWWRLRALLLWKYGFRDGPPRDENWREILERGARHDPDNALYDYLAAAFYWRTSAEVQFVEPGKDTLLVTDSAGFALGVEAFARGQQKPYFVIGDAGFSATAEFLKRTALPLREHWMVANSVTLHARRSMLLLVIWRRQDARSKLAEAEGDIAEALRLKRENLHLIDQFMRSNAPFEYAEVPAAMRIASLFELHALARAHPDLVSKEELSDLDELEKEARLARAVEKQAGQDMALSTTQEALNGKIASAPFNVLQSVIVGLSPSLVVALLAMALATAAAARLKRSQDLPGIRWFEHAAMLAAALAVTVVVFGLAPSHIIPEIVQAWAFTLAIIGTPIVVAAWIAWRLLGRRVFQFRLRTMLACIFAFCFLLGLVSIAGSAEEIFGPIPMRFSIPPREMYREQFQIVESVLKPQGPWLMTALHWVSYHGQYATLGLWTLFAALVLHRRIRRANPESASTGERLRDRIGTLASTMSRCSLLLALAILAIYLFLAPAAIDKVESEFQRQIAFSREPDEHWRKVHQAIERVRSDPERMKSLRETVEAELVRDRAQNSDN